jgi:PAS domain S-box-containing protein
MGRPVVKSVVRGAQGLPGEGQEQAKDTLYGPGRLNQQIIDSLGEGLIVYDREGRVVLWNRFMEEMTGLKEEAVKGRLGWELSPFLRELGWEERIRRALAGETVVDPDFSFAIPETGRSGWNSGRLGPLRNANGEIVGALATVLDITALKQAEEALSEASRFYRQVVNSLGHGVLALDREGRYILWNPFLEQMTGIPAQEVLGKHPWEVVPQVDEQELQSDAAAALGGRSVLRADRLYTIPSTGRSLWVSYRVEPLWSVEGRIIGVLANVQDVTARHWAEERLRQRLRQQDAVARLSRRALAGGELQALFEQTANVLAETLELEFAKVLELLPDGRSLLLRAGVGWKEGLVGQARVSAGQESQAGYTLEASEPVIVEDLSRESRFTGPRLLLDHGVVSGMSVIIAGAERPFGVLGVHTTQRRSFTPDDVQFLQSIANLLAVAIRNHQAEAARRESERRFRRLVDSGIIGIYLADLSGRLLEANEVFLRMLGYTREDLAQGLLRSDNITPPQWAPRDQQAADELRRRGVCAPFEKEYLRQDGTPLPVLLGVAMLDAAAEVCIGYVLDISERKRAEADLRQLSAQLLQLQDEERRRVARELHDTTSQNLAALEISLSLVSKAVQELPAAARQALEKGVSLAAECSRQIRSLSYLLHPPLLEELGLVAALRSYAEGFSRRTGIHVSLEAAEAGRLPREAELTLFRVVQEALANIHRHAASPTAQVRLDRTAAEVRLAVTDQGRGIPQEVLAGTAPLGVGIAGMRERVRQLGGRLDITSSDRGCTVSVALPVGSR